MSTQAQTSGSTIYCSFCGKSQHEVRKLIAGPGVFICDEDVMVCLRILIEPAPIPYPAAKPPSSNAQGAE